MKKILSIILFTFLLFGNFNYINASNQSNIDKIMNNFYLKLDESFSDIERKIDKLEVIVNKIESIKKIKWNKLSDNSKELLSLLELNINNKIKYYNKEFIEKLNSEAKIYDAYILDELVDIGEDEYIGGESRGDEISNDLRKSLKRVKGTNFFVGNSSIYFEYVSTNKIEGSILKDPKGVVPFKSFTGSNFMINGNELYFFRQKVINGDLSTLKFKTFGNETMIAGDKNNIYISLGHIFPGKNVQNIEILDGGCFKDNINVICNFSESEGTMYKIVEGADPKTFTLIKYPFCKDINNIYYYGNKIEGVDSKTFELLGNFGYSRDKNGVYHGGTKINGADIITFQILNLNNEELFNGDAYSKDKNYVYQNGFIIKGINPNGFDLEKYLKEKKSSN